MTIRQLKTEDAIGFKLWRGVFNKMQTPHNHNDIEINFLLSGWVRYIHGGKLYEIKAHEFTVFWGGIPHNVIDLEEGLIAYWITLPLEWLIKWNIPSQLMEKILAGEMIRQITSIEDNKHNESSLDLWLREFQTNSEVYFKNIQLELESKFRRLSQSFQENTTAKNYFSQEIHKPFNQLIKFVSQNYITIQNIEEIGKELKLHPKYLMQMFKKHTNMNLWEYILHLRVSHSQRLLITTKDKMIDICFASGFQSNSNFYYIFEKFNKGISPAKYRKNHLKI